MTIGLPHLGLVTLACARVIPTQVIARTEVIANASLCPISGFALQRRAQMSARIGPVRHRPVTNSPSSAHQFTNSRIYQLVFTTRVMVHAERRRRGRGRRPL